MDQKKSKNSSPRIKIIQKLYSSVMNPNSQIDYPKSQYKKLIKDVVTGTLERSNLIEETIDLNLRDDVDLKKVTQDVASFSNKTLILDPRVKGRVSIFSDTILTSQQVWEVYLRTIQVSGFSAISDGEDSWRHKGSRQTG